MRTQIVRGSWGGQSKVALFKFELGLTHSKLFFVFAKEHTEGVAMNKSDLIDAMADLAGLSKAEAGRALEAFIEAAKNALKKNDTISLVGFGTFSVRERAARTGRNPRTGETIQIKASKNPTFKAGKALKDAVN